MRFVWTLAVTAALAASVALKPAAAQVVDAPQVSSQISDAYQPAFSDRLMAPGAPTEHNAWRGLVWPPMSGGAIDRFALAGGDALQGPGGRTLIVGRFGEDGPLSQLTNGTFGRDWPSAVRLKTGAFGFDVTPHAGLAASGAGGAQNAGALIRFGRGLGLADGEPGRRGKWFLFASTNQENLGLGFMRNEEAWRRYGIAPDPGALIGDTRAGLAWRDGPFEASVGYLYREIRPHDLDVLDVSANREHLVAFRLTLHPGSQK
jgi:hypothetical protein